MSYLAVDPVVYDAASATVGVELATAVAQSYHLLTVKLAVTGAMAGHDTAGRSWGTSYDAAVQASAEGLAALQQAFVSLGGMLRRTGFNHSLAESASDSGSGRDYLVGVDNSIAPKLYSHAGDFPAAAGGSGSYPTGWSLVKTLVHFDWPDGSPEWLRHAESAWKGAAGTLDGLVSLVDKAVTRVEQQQSPEVVDASIVCRGMRAHLTGVADVCYNLGVACAAYAEAVEAVHSQCIGLLSDLASDVEQAAVIGLLLGGESEGSSEDVALEYGGSRALIVAAEVAEHLADFGVNVAEVVQVQTTTSSEVADIVQSLQPILGKTPTTADTIIQAGGPVAAAQNDEVIFTKRLATAAKINWAGLEDAELRGGHTIREHVGKSDAYLIHRARPGRKGKRRASTFPTLGAAEKATSGNIADHGDEIHSSIEAHDDKVTIRERMNLPGSRTYVRATGKFLHPSEVVTVIVEGPSGYYVRTSYPN